MESDDETHPYKCTQCTEHFFDMQDVKTHFESVHEGKLQANNGSETKAFMCAICKTRFKHKYHMKHHIESIHEGKELFDCVICEDKFRSRSQLMGK